MPPSRNELEACPGCGGLFEPHSGPIHRYMISSPACWAAFGKILACEYSDPALLATHRLSVDAFAVQHPGGASRQAIQSVGLHLVRLMIQLETPLPPREANDVMLRLGPRKALLPFLQPPESFQLTVADVVPAAGTAGHIEAVRAWAKSAWNSWATHQSFIRSWAEAG